MNAEVEIREWFEWINPFGHREITESLPVAVGFHMLGSHLKWRGKHYEQIIELRRDNAELPKALDAARASLRAWATDPSRGEAIAT